MKALRLYAALIVSFGCSFAQSYVATPNPGDPLRITGATGPAGPGYGTLTSTSSLTIGTGPQTFTISACGAYGAGAVVLATYSMNATDYMFGNVTSCSGTTLIVNITSVGGSGTFASWNINLSGIPGGVISFNTRTGTVSLSGSDVTTALGYTPLSPANNLSDVSSASTSRTNLGLGTAAVQNIGTNGANLGLLNANLTFSGTNAYGTPVSITLTNGTALPISGIAGLGTGVPTFLATPSASNFASMLTSPPLPRSVGGTNNTAGAIPQQFFGTAAPGSVAGNLPGDFFSDTTNHNDYWCNAASGTAAPACTSVTAGGWTLLNGGGGPSAFNAITSGTNTSAAMVIGSGASLGVTGTGTNTSNAAQSNSSDPGTCAAGALEFNSTGAVFKGCTATNTWTTFASGSSTAFSSLTSGTNTAMAGVVGSGASLGFTGTGTIAANNTGFGLTLSSGNIAANTAVLADWPLIQAGSVSLTLTSSGVCAFTANMPNSALTAYTSGMYVSFTPDTTCATPTLAINGLAALTIYQANGTTAGAVTAGYPYWLKLGAAGAANCAPGVNCSWLQSPSSSATGTVTTFSAGNLSPLFTTSVATATTTPALTFALSNAAQNSVFAGPATGGAGAPSYQTAPTISAANMTNLPITLTTTGTSGAATYTQSTNTLNIPQYTGSGGTGNAAAQHSVSFSATPTFTCSSSSAGTVDVFNVAQLTGNITSSTLSGCTTGQLLLFRFQQASGGGDTVAMPTGFDSLTISPTANIITTAEYQWDGTNAHLLPPASTDTATFGFGPTRSAPSGNPASGLYTWWDSTYNTASYRDTSGNNYYAPHYSNPSNANARGIGAGWGVKGGTTLTTSQVIYQTWKGPACTITGWAATVDTGTITFDVWKIATGTAIPTVTNTIVASAAPAISSNTAANSTTLTGWTTSVARGDILGFNISALTGSPTTASLVLECDQ